MKNKSIVLGTLFILVFFVPIYSSYQMTPFGLEQIVQKQPLLGQINRAVSLKRGFLCQEKLLLCGAALFVGLFLGHFGFSSFRNAADNTFYQEKHKIVEQMSGYKKLIRDLYMGECRHQGDSFKFSPDTMLNKTIQGDHCLVKKEVLCVAQNASADGHYFDRVFVNARVAGVCVGFDEPFSRIRSPVFRADNNSRCQNYIAYEIGEELPSCLNQYCLLLNEAQSNDAIKEIIEKVLENFNKDKVKVRCNFLKWLFECDYSRPGTSSAFVIILPHKNGNDGKVIVVSVGDNVGYVCCLSDKDKKVECVSRRKNSSSDESAGKLGIRVEVFNTKELKCVYLFTQGVCDLIDKKTLQNEQKNVSTILESVKNKKWQECELKRAAVCCKLYF